MEPPDARKSSTREPESAEVMKKKMSTIIASTLNTVGSTEGNTSKAWKMVVTELTVGSPVAGSVPIIVPNWFCTHSAKLPNTVNHTRLTRVGASSTPMMNSRMVRPREMRAMKMPTNGAQLTHQPQ